MRGVNGEAVNGGVGVNGESVNEVNGEVRGIKKIRKTKAIIEAGAFGIAKASNGSEDDVTIH